MQERKALAVTPRHRPRPGGHFDKSKADRERGILPFRKAMEFTNPDYAALGRVCAAQGFTVRDPALLESTLIEAFACSGPAIVACGVVPDEMPKLPHVELEQIVGYALASQRSDRRRHRRLTGTRPLHSSHAPQGLPSMTIEALSAWTREQKHVVAASILG